MSQGKIVATGLGGPVEPIAVTQLPTSQQDDLMGVPDEMRRRVQQCLQDRDVEILHLQATRPAGPRLLRDDLFGCGDCPFDLR